MNLKHRACGGRPACNHSFAAPDSFLTAMRSSGKATAALPTTKQWSLGLQLVGYVTKAHGQSSPRREAIGEIPFERHLHQASFLKDAQSPASSTSPIEKLLSSFHVWVTLSTAGTGEFIHVCSPDSLNRTFWCKPLASKMEVRSTVGLAPAVPQYGSRVKIGEPRLDGV